SRLVLRWPMPFATAKISLLNEGKSPVNLDVGARVREFNAAPSPYRFCALQNAVTTQQGKPVEILNLTGEGAFVGLALSIAPNAESQRRTFAYLEGNELITADGKPFEGTGNEDFFSSAWYFPDKPFSHPYEGLTLKVPSPPTVSAYRWMIPDAIPFKRSLRFDFEHGNGNNSADLEWKWTAIWYQKPPLSLPATATTVAAGETAPAAPLAPSERWKIAIAVGAGVILGVFLAWWKRRRR
ncbi:MAG: DUF2961 domain-containing protein, partial [Armatimonadetes bacterium]|nr:DUF2961 domain-containing protein [Armatimonadota bacterium]